MSKQDAILEMAKIGLVDGVFSMLELAREDSELEDEVLEALDDLDIPQEDLLYTVPDTFRSWGLNFDDYLPIEWATGVYNDTDSRLRELGTSFDELEEMDSEFPYLVIMSYMGHGVGIFDSNILSDYFRDLGISRGSEITGSGEAPYNEATEAFDDLVNVIESNLD